MNARRQFGPSVKTTLLTLLLGATCCAHAHTHVFQAVLSGQNESVPNSSPGIGTSTVTLDLDLINMLVEIDFSGLAGNSTAAFIHAPTSVPLTGTAGPMTPAFSDSGFPLGVTGGTYSHLFDLTDASGYNPAFITASGGTVSDALNALAFSFEDGKAYVNIQSAAFPNGEIRGFYTEVQDVPEPASIPMICLGGCLLTSLRRRR
jgi:CHRD domain/PEP-CTERM motif